MQFIFCHLFIRHCQRNVRSLRKVTTIERNNQRALTDNCRAKQDEGQHGDFEDLVSVDYLKSSMDRMKEIDISSILGSTLAQRTTKMPKEEEDPHEGPQHAAVLVALCRDEDGRPSVIFTLRSSQMRNSRNTMSFPGGLENHSDENEYISTALRETEEEIGLSRQNITPIGVLNPIPTLSRDSLVFPVIGHAHVDHALASGEPLKLNKDEVEQVYFVPLSTICNPAYWSATAWRSGYSTPVFLPPGVPRIWGLTGIILYITMFGLAPKHFNIPLHFTPRITHKDRR